MKFTGVLLLLVLIVSCKKQADESCSCNDIVGYSCMSYEQTMSSDPWGEYSLPTDTLIVKLVDHFSPLGIDIIEPQLINQDANNCMTPEAGCKTGRIYCVMVVDSVVSDMIANGFQSQ